MTALQIVGQALLGCGFAVACVCSSGAVGWALIRAGSSAWYGLRERRFLRRIRRVM